METLVAETTRDEYAGKLPAQVPIDVLRRLSVVNPAISLLHILAEWVAIVGGIWLCWHFWSLALYVLAVIWIGSRQHALGILMHEGSHYRLVRSKTLNDWLSDIFLAWPILITTESYRANHWQHHRHTNTEKDPDCHRKLFQLSRKDWEFPKSWPSLAVLGLKDLTAISSFAILKTLFSLSNKPKTKQAAKASVQVWVRLGFYIAILGSAAAFGFWKQLLLLWIVPYLTTFNLLLHLRSIAEHFGTENDHPLNITRTTLTAPWEKIFFSKNVNYHIEHHLYPSVPFYRLPELHQVLMEQPAFRRNSHLTHTYFGVLRECVRLNGFKRTCLSAKAEL